MLVNGTKTDSQTVLVSFCKKKKKLKKNTNNIDKAKHKQKVVIKSTDMVLWYQKGKNIHKK